MEPVCMAAHFVQSASLWFHPNTCPVAHKHTQTQTQADWHIYTYSSTEIRRDGFVQLLGQMPDIMSCTSNLLLECKKILQVTLCVFVCICVYCTSPSCPVGPSTLTCWASALGYDANKLLRLSGSVYTGALLLMGTSWEWWRYMHSQTKPHI